MTCYAYKITINNKIDVILSTSSTAHWFYNHKEVDNNNKDNNFPLNIETQ